MKFVTCNREPHKEWGFNDPINLEHVITYSAGTVRPRMNSTKSEAPAIVFTTGRGLPITWSFVDERQRDWELGRLMELTYEPDASEVLAVLRDAEPASVELSTEAELKATPKYTTIYRDGVRVGVSCNSEAAWRELQERFETMSTGRTMELPDGVQILSVFIDAQRVGVMEKSAHAYQFCVPAGGFPDRVAKDAA